MARRGTRYILYGQRLRTRCPSQAPGTGPVASLLALISVIGALSIAGASTDAGGDGDLHLAGDLPTLPLFDPGTSIADGHRILADAVATAKGKSRLPQAPMPLLTQPGPFNPAASLSTKVVKKILDLEFVEMSEITIDDVLPAVPGRPPPPARLPISPSGLSVTPCSRPSYVPNSLIKRASCWPIRHRSFAPRGTTRGSAG